MTAQSFEALFNQASNTDEYWTERAKLDFVGSLNAQMQRHGISKAELARRLDVSSAYVTKIFRGDANFTLATMVRLARAVGGEFRSDIVKDGAASKLFEGVPRPPTSKRAEVPATPATRP